ncbi:hypothetical protein CHARACLAT_011635 [Characodon lateralis]|uniref:Uncharacterized protein n=1 Tax=Characodon lateralis TaxID=208331 RepID=A0ABU7DZQ5_9TELE|nr:hypothetical protein [Characodon lateralis]
MSASRLLRLDQSGCERGVGGRNSPETSGSESNLTTNTPQIRTSPRPIIPQGITFKDLLHGRHRSSAELRPSSTPSPP